MNNCPYCGQEMEEGRLMASPKSYFLPLGEEKPMSPFILKGTRAISLAPPLLSSINQANPAFVCRSCKTLIMPFPKT